MTAKNFGKERLRVLKGSKLPPNFPKIEDYQRQNSQKSAKVAWKLRAMAKIVWLRENTTVAHMGGDLFWKVGMLKYIAEDHRFTTGIVRNLCWGGLRTDRGAWVRDAEGMGEGNGERVSPWGGIPLPSRLGSLGERRKLPQLGPGWSPGRKRILCILSSKKRIWWRRIWYFCHFYSAYLVIFTRLAVPCTL